MQNQNPSANIPPTPAPNASSAPTPGMPQPGQYPYPPPAMPNGPAQPPYPSPSMPNGPVQYPYQQPPYPSPYPQYPPYTPGARPTNKGAGTSGLIGGAIACGINVFIGLLITFVPAIGSALNPLYQIVPLLPSGMLSIGTFIISLIIALLCSPGFFVAGLLAKRKTGRTSSAMLACTLALVGFVVIDFILIITLSFYNLFIAFHSGLYILMFSEFVFIGWFSDLIMVSMVSFGAAVLGGAIGKQR